VYKIFLISVAIAVVAYAAINDPVKKY